MNCKRCSVELSGRQTVFCSTRCKNQQAAVDWRRKLKRKAVEYLGGKCSRCGYSRCISALTFHHRKPSEKEFSFGEIRWKSWDDMVKELKKCDLLCRNCHAEEHCDYEEHTPE